MVDDENFARRWSRRKQAVHEEEQQAAVAPAAPEEPAAPEDRPETVPDDLPDIESLDADSDYRVFMRDDVPEDLRTLALRKLWRSNPLFSIIDGLDEYAEDFTDAALVPKGGVTSAYKIGRGYAEEAVDKVAEAPLLEEAEEIEKIEQAEVAEIPEADEESEESGGEPDEEEESAEVADPAEPISEAEPPVEKS